MEYNKSIFTKYMLLAFGLAWPLQIIGSVLAIKGIQAGFSLCLALAMFMPLIAAWRSGAGIKNIGWKPVFKKKVRYIIIGLFLPVVMCLIGAGIYFLVRPDALDLTGTLLAESMPEVAVKQLEASGISMQTLLLISLIQSSTYAPFINMFFACGEEAGWRGVMVPMLKDKMGFLKGHLISGIIWGIWHAPVILIAGYEYGAPVWDKPVLSILGVFEFCIFTTAYSIILDWLYVRSTYIWVPALCHGAVNAVAGVFAYTVSPEFVGETMLGPMPVGIIAMIPFIVFAIVLLVKGYEKTE